MNKYYKFVIAAVMIALGIYVWIEFRQTGWGIVLIILSASPVLLFFKNEFLLLAFWFLRKQKFDKAAKWLTGIKDFQKQLHRSQWGYFHYLKGLMLAENQPAKAEPLMRKALEYGLNMKLDRATATLNLAAAAIYKGRKYEAQHLIEEAKKLDSGNMLAEQIKTLKGSLKMPSMQKHIHNPNMRMRGKYF